MNSRERLLALWHHYSEGVSSAQLELTVAQRALRDGRCAKEVTLMLVAGSETVRLIYNKQGRKEAMVKDRPKGPTLLPSTWLLSRASTAPRLGLPSITAMG
ncbi:MULTISPECIES: hypothetical protein [Cyanophyceae]|uniref:Uncharacterized protein n=1 Tax=Leptolyngbya subtilissima DQ-A4 TaxID=2933933 RepID=A0ABV0K211_9CYAN|nr:hypothetical protein [Nodosilinea sp. FACHB-141]MBD2112588.1 hypothetical protein [Nodosilinea sp. FACHB-141]